MKIIAIILIVVGIIGVLLSSLMFGDIGLAALIGSIASLLSGIGFLQVNKALQGLNR